MKRFSQFAAMTLLLAGSVGCVGPQVEIPTAHVGKIMTTSGLQEGLKYPSTFRLPYNFLGNNPTKAILVECSDEQKVESMKLFMPKDKLNMEFDVRGTYSIAVDETQLNKIYDRLVSIPGSSPYIEIIDFDVVYSNYAGLVVTTTCRAILTRYEIEYIMSHREEISKLLEKEVSARLEGTPISVKNFGLSKIQPPELILEAQKATKAREVAIDQAKADRLVKLTEAEAELEVARRQQQVDLLHADTQRQVGLKMTKGVNQAFIQQRVLTILESLSTSKDRVIILPEPALQNQALMTAVNQKIVSGDTTPATPAAPQKAADAK